MTASRIRSFLPCLRNRIQQRKKYILALIFVLFTATHIQNSLAYFNDSMKPERSDQAVSLGKLTFLTRCSFCHGAEGRGDGPAAKYLDPKPRNFRTGVFKLRSTASGALPTDEDLFHTIKNGVPGTAMPAFGSSKNGLSDNSIWQVIFFLQTLSDLWTDDEEFSKSQDPDDIEDYRYNRVEEITSPPLFTRKLLEKGSEVYTKAKCYECHGKNGRGDGETAYTLKNDWNEAIFPLNLHKSWLFKGGNSVTNIFKTITTGMNGTPMPSFRKALTEEERWALSFYVNSLAAGFSEQKLLKVKHTEAEIPVNPTSLLWETAEEHDIPLSGQILTIPRWPIHSIDLVRVKALYNDKNIAFLLTWDDRQRDAITTALPPDSEQNAPEKLPDGLVLQFFPDTQLPLDLPHFLNGSPDKKVRIWFWSTTKENGINGNTSVREFSAAGPKKPFTYLPNKEQKPVAASFYSDGQWQLILISPLNNEIFSKAREGLPLSFALNAWDGSAGELGLKKSISSWRWIRLLPADSKRIYIYPLLTFLFTFNLRTLLFLTLSRQKEPLFRNSNFTALDSNLKK